MYGMEWLIVLGLLGLALGLGAGFLLGGAGFGGGRRKQLEEQLAKSQEELTSYRQEVVSQFSETARKFQTLNDAYTDLHRQLAHSSKVLCKDVNGPLLAAPVAHPDLIPEEIRDGAEAAEPKAATDSGPGGTRKPEKKVALAGASEKPDAKTDAGTATTVGTAANRTEESPDSKQSPATGPASHVAGLKSEVAGPKSEAPAPGSKKDAPGRDEVASAARAPEKAGSPAAALEKGTIRVKEPTAARTAVADAAAKGGPASAAAGKGAAAAAATRPGGKAESDPDATAEAAAKPAADQTVVRPKPRRVA